ncbi:thiamine ABC transporter substrate-binding protein [Fusobacterium varium]|uniref:thiamine ABC transporter substrate-binding protein n=1 Tax=Fusobacterium varium TaxID=856 RepID=UPI003052C5F5
MKKLILSLLLILSVSSFSEEIIVYGPSSAKWIGKSFAPIFKEKTGVDIKFISIDGLVSRLKLEEKNPKADIVIGLTSLSTEIAKKENLITPYIPKNISNIKSSDFLMDKEGYATPFDYGLLAINYDTKKIPVPPKNLAELGKLEKQLLVENPATSSTGEEALLWSIALYGENWKNFWNVLKPAIYTAEPGWSEAFAKFTAGEAPMMVRYATSNLFFSQDEEQSRFSSFLLEDGTFMYLEGASLVNKKETKEGAKKFMEYVLSEDFQNLVPQKNYMFPVTEISLTEEFKFVPVAEKTVKLSDEQVKDLVKNLDIYKSELIEILKK